MASDPVREDFISRSDDFSKSNDDSDLPKNLNIKFDFCEDEFEMPESDGHGASVKLSLSWSFFPVSCGVFLCLMSDVRMMRMMTAKIAPDPIAISSKSPCDSPSIETFGTEMKENCELHHFCYQLINDHLPYSKLIEFACFFISFHCDLNKLWNYWSWFGNAQSCAIKRFLESRTEQSSCAWKTISCR